LGIADGEGFRFGFLDFIRVYRLVFIVGIGTSNCQLNSKFVINFLKVFETVSIFSKNFLKFFGVF
jgi:hypothetical protein